MPHHRTVLAAAMLAALAIAANAPAEAPRTKPAVVTPDVVRAAAEAPLRAQRARYPAYFARAYARYPELPRGVLEAIAWSETGWRHVLPDPADGGHRHMPAAWGVMGLYHGEGFEDQVAAGAKLAGLPASLVMRDPESNILAAAALLDQASRRNRAAGLPSARADDVDAMSAVLARYAGYGPATGDIRTYARQSFAYAVLSTLQRGVDADGAVVPARAVRMERAFTPTQLRKLRAPALRIDADRDRVDIDAAPAPRATRKAGAATLAGDFGEAIWNPAYSGNYSTAANAMTAVILHTMEGSYAGSISWFQNPSAVVSAHYLVRKSDGQITQMVREYHQAYHAKYHNNYTIGIEHDGYASDPGNWSAAMVNASARLTRSICARRGVNCASAWQGPGYDTWHLVPDSVRVKGHGMLTQNENRYDPGKYFPWSSYYSLINGGGGNPNPPTGTYWVDTFADATGYKWPSTLTPLGTLYKGTNYVYCKAWGEQVGSGGSYNHYWLKTDLDVGPAGAWVSAYYLSRWGNDEARDNNGAVIPDC